MRKPLARLIACLVGVGGLSNTYSAADTPHTLTVAWESAPRSFDPRYAVDAHSQYLENLLHCSLIAFDPKGTVIGDLAQSWQWKSPTNLELEIRDNAQFSDGSPLTAEDVKTSYEFFIEKKHAVPSPRSGVFAGITSITAVGKTISFNLAAPDATFVTNLVVGILPRKWVSDKLVTSDDKVAGCGPFTLRHASLTSILLEANPRYSLGKPPMAKNLEIKIVKEENTRYAKLRNGEIDIAQNNISLEKLPEIAKQRDLKILRRAGLKTTYLGFNTSDRYLSSRKVRQAISQAINRDAIIKYLLKGMAIPASTLLPPNHVYYNKELAGPTYDVEKAKRLLDEAGFKQEGARPRFALTYKTSNDATRLAIAKAIASDLSRVGIRVNVQPLEWGRFKEDVDKGHVQLWGLTWIGFKDPDIYRYAFATDSFPPNGGNRGRFSNPELDRLLAEARTSTSEEIRGKAYQKIQALVAEQAPYAFLFHEENYAVVRSAIEGFDIYADGRYAALKFAHKAL